MPRTTVSVEFGQGLDTKTDPKVAAKPTSLTDCIFTKLKRLSKRNGHDAMALSIVGGGTIASPKMAASYRNEILAAGTGSNGKRLFSYSSALSAWKDVGKYNSIKVSKQVIDSIETAPLTATAPITGAANSSSVISGSIALYAFDGSYANNANKVFITVVDTATGSHLADRVEITSSLGYVKGYSKACLLGASTFAVFYIGDSNITSAPTTTARACLRVITVTLGGGVSVGSEVVLGSGVRSLTVAGLTPYFTYGYDVGTTSAGAVVAMCNSPNINVVTINTSGAVTHSLTISSTGTITPLSLTLDSTATNAWLYWVSAGTDLYYSVFSASSLAGILAPVAAQAGLSSIQQICALPVSASSQTVYLSKYTKPAASLTNGVYYPVISQQSVTSAGSFGSATTFLSGADIYSRPIAISGVNYMACVTVSPTNPVGLLVDLSDGGVSAKFLPGSAEGVYKITANNVSSSPVDPEIVQVRYPGFLSTILSLGSSQYSLCSGYVISLTTAAQSSASSGASYPATITSGATVGVASVVFDFASVDSYQSIIQQDTVVLNGGLLEQYDGAYISELGFTIDPDGVSLFFQNSGGGIGTGKFTYYYIYRWTDANGNLHQSAPSIGTTVVTTSGTTNRINIGFSPLIFTQKTNVLVSFYRTKADGTIPYLFTSVANPTGYTLIVDDSSDDASLASNPSLYTEGGSIVENIAPPPAVIMWTANNRLSVVDSEDPSSKIEYSKTASEGSGISFSSGILEYIVDSYGGAISGAIRLDEKQIILKKSAIGFFIGDGADDSGNGSTLTPIQFIPADTGCISSKSVISYPAGILFKSPKGIYQLNRGMQITYFGTEVEQYNAQDISSAVLVYDKNQIRFLTSSGTNLTYDYVMGQWSAFSNPAGVSASIFNNLYVYVASDGRIFQENTTSFLDDSVGYAPDIYLQWIKASSIQGFQRCRAIEMLGDFLVKNNGHGVQISTAWDFDSSNFSAPVVYSFSDKDANGFYQYRQHLTRQKGDAFQLRIKEIITNASGEYIDFTDLSLEITPKVGMNKVSGSRSVG